MRGGVERLEQLLAMHGAALEMFAAQWTRYPEDCVQEAFIALAAEKQEPDDGVAWLFRVVRNRAISARRADVRRQKHEAAVGEARKLFAEDVEPGQAEAASSALAALDDDAREVIVARIWGKLTFEQLAAVIGVSTSTAHRRYEAALQTLRDRLGPTWLIHHESTAT